MWPKSCLKCKKYAGNARKDGNIHQACTRGTSSSRRRWWGISIFQPKALEVSEVPPWSSFKKRTVQGNFNEFGASDSVVAFLSSTENVAIWNIRQSHGYDRHTDGDHNWSWLRSITKTVFWHVLSTPIKNLCFSLSCLTTWHFVALIKCAQTAKAKMVWYLSPEQTKCQRAKKQHHKRRIEL